ncbi:MAG: hypothetical protein COS92_07585 [Desulfobacterales bacterium CG07_land_8_20_14_0_80_52_14]|nr:MAG: hypothetical protein COS92_07585 [Desulfobacterales bacterium CG07_land_8_20_14_0_80_52_14]
MGKIQITREEKVARKKSPIGLFAVYFAAVVVAAGCGYRFAGSGSFPAGVKKIHIALLDNRTTETGIEKDFTDDLIDEFIRRNEEGLVNAPEDADAVLSGVIAAMAVETISRTGASTSDERRVTITVVLKLTDQKKRVIWSGSVSEDEAYPVAGDRLTTDQNRREAIKALSKLMAERVYNNLTAGF